ncbi:hypothetical protein B0H19DRAFT_1070324 [Mycena capillaripes]|nr:hypothetical protein B0H19DRAFT_1070324 [Mycena capillaripes]
MSSSGIMNQFMRDSMTNGSLPAALAANTHPAASSSAPLPTLSISPALLYTSAWSQPIALPAAPAGHPLPLNNLSGYNSTQPMLGMGGLGIPVSGHSNHPHRFGIDKLSPTQISETNVIRRAAARDHLGHQLYMILQSPEIFGETCGWMGNAFALHEAVVIRGSSVLEHGPPSGVSLTFVGSFPEMNQTQAAHLFQAWHIPPLAPQIRTNPAHLLQSRQIDCPYAKAVIAMPVSALPV